MFKGWETITTSYNANCSGIKRDTNALKMKLKNIKASTSKKRPKLEHSPSSTEITTERISRKLSGNDDDDEEMDEDDEDQEYEEHEIIIHNSSESFNKARKRCKKFTKAESALLETLYEKHFFGLDSSCSATSVKKRSDAWTNITKSFNEQNSGVSRDISELKIKIKNIKAMRMKGEQSMTNSRISTDETFTTPVLVSKVTATEEQKPTKPVTIIDALFEEDFEDEEEVHTWFLISTILFRY